MTRTLPDVLPAPGQSVTVRGGPGLRIGYDKARTYMTVTAPGTYTDPIPPSPPTIPPGSVALSSKDDIFALLAAGKKVFYLLDDGVHRFGFGKFDTTWKDISLLSYPGQRPIIDGTGLADQHFLYLGPLSGTWTLGVKIIGFRPIDSGIVAIGDGCRLIRVAGYQIVGVGPAGPWPVTSGPQNCHGEYFHGTGTASGPIDITNVPGSAVTSWRGSPVVTLDGGRAGSHYISLLGGAGRITANGVDFVRADGTQTGPLPKMDVQQYRGTEPEADPNATVILNLCTGTGPGATVRRAG